ncbi:putative SPEAR family protein [Helianthus annuus]|uniref:SPEAR family protein n=1 Tax=Helianthus annuus TaxID=4232 RepID=A0A251SZ05_HELAN|nr:protein SPEAR1 [Helianthus annuus]KAF5802801.1 putative SPEAR family protein [Helianthus annuus]KAJ0567338.1 putative SPEAR family protein [Helianthus annuus]
MSYFGDASGIERSARASSSRKGKKSNSDKPKQPQRGLGVAQLEKIRLHSELGFHPTNIHPQMGMGDLDRSNMAYVQSQPSSDLRWSNASNAIYEAERYAKPAITAHLFQVKVEDTLRMKDWSDSMGSSSHNTDSNGSQELDLELRLSL